MIHAKKAFSGAHIHTQNIYDRGGGNVLGIVFSDFSGDYWYEELSFADIQAGAGSSVGAGAGRYAMSST